MHKLSILTIISFFCIIFADPYAPLDIDFLKNNPKVIKKSEVIKVQEKPQAPKTGLPAYEELIKDLDKIEGLFNFYWDKEKNKILLSLTPEQLEVTFLANLTRRSGDASYYDSGNMLWEFPFQFKKLTDNIQFVHINTDFRADESSAIHRSIKNNFSNSIVSVGKIISSPHPETGAILIDANSIFVNDIAYISERRKGQYRFDKNNSYVSDLQSFPYNSEIQITAHFISSKWTGAYTIPNSHSMMHVYHISLSAILNSDFSPRIADDRVGYYNNISRLYYDIKGNAIH